MAARGVDSDAMAWQPLITDDEIAAFQHAVFDFHDGVLREAYLSFGTHLGSAGVAYFDTTRALTVHLLIQLPANLFPRPRAVERAAAAAAHVHRLRHRDRPE